MNVTVCLTQSRTASFTCVVDRRSTSITTAEWNILDVDTFISVASRRRHMTNAIRDGNIITDTLTVTNVSVDDNGAQYRCQPVNGVNSMTVTITVLGMCPYRLF